MLSLFIILVLVLLNGLFVAAEFALIAAPKALIEKRAAQGNRRAKLALSVMQDPQAQDRYIATTQLGITFASLGLGMYGEQVLAHMLIEPLASLGVGSMQSVHAVASAIAIACLTYLHIVIGEMVPKTIALEYSEEAVLWISAPVSWFTRLLLPLVVFFNALASLLLRMLGVKRSLTQRSPTADDLRSIVEESIAEGQLGNAGQVLKELLDFGERTAAEVMTPRVRIVGIPSHATAQDLRHLLRSSRHTRYPVYSDTLDRIVGVVSIRDLFAVLIENRGLREAPVRPVPFVPETARLESVLSRMRKAKAQLVVVMDEHGGTAGIVTIEDLALEVVGTLTDSRASMSPVYKVDSELRALGLARLDEVGEQLELPLEHDEVDTVSGLVLCLLGRPPVVGDSVVWKDVRFTVLSIEGHGVKECAVQPPAGFVSPSTRPPDENR